MSLRLKILLGILAVYTIAVSVLLIIAGRRLSEVDSERLKYQKLEHLINEVHETNNQIKETIAQDEQKIDSISVLITRVEKSLMVLEKEREAVNKNYQIQIESLKDKSLLDLKKIALEE